MIHQGPPARETLYFVGKPNPDDVPQRTQTGIEAHFGEHHDGLATVMDTDVVAGIEAGLDTIPGASADLTAVADNRAVSIPSRSAWPWTPIGRTCNRNSFGSPSESLAPESHRIPPARPMEGDPWAPPAAAVSFGRDPKCDCGARCGPISTYVRGVIVDGGPRVCC